MLEERVMVRDELNAIKRIKEEMKKPFHNLRKNDILHK